MLQVHKIHGRKPSFNFQVITTQLEGVPLDAEENVAMSMAMYSRSPKSIVDHIEKVNTAGSGNFLETYYIGYGHDSIGDCVNVQMYVENVSMLAAKNIQNHPLYNGQEASTRYLDFSTAEFAVASKNPLVRNYVEELRTFYKESMPIVVAAYADANNIDMTPITVPVKERSEELKKLATAQTTVKAKAFDVMRGFLPYGACTNVAITMNARALREHCWNLRASAIPEVAALGDTILEALEERYKHSFGRVESESSIAERAAQLKVLKQMELDKAKQFGAKFGDDRSQKVFGVLDETFSCPSPEHKHGFNIGFRPWMSVGMAEFFLDIGSYRDLQRHRSVFKNFPIATTEFGVEPWYLEQLPDQLRTKAETLLKKAKTIAALHSDEELAQYAIPMAYRVHILLQGSLVDFDYITNLRSSESVHPTLRSAIQVIANIANFSGYDLRCNTNPAPKFNVRRGTQDIVEK